MNRWRAFLAILLAALVLQPVASRAEETEKDDHWHLPAACEPRETQTLTIREAQRKIKKLERECVRVTGLLDGDILHANHEAMYRGTSQFKRRHVVDAPWRNALGLRPIAKKIGLPKRDGRLARVTLVGRIHDCRRDWGAKKGEDGEIIIGMGTGWCHYNSEPVLTVTAFENHAPITVGRLHDARSAKRLGDLRPLEPESPLLPVIEPVIDQWLVALRAGDRATLLRLHDVWVDLDPDGAIAAADRETNAGKSAQRLLDTLLMWPAHPVAALRSGMQLRQRQLFVGRWEKKPDVVYACWHVSPEQSVAWPISSLDTGDVEGRPYSCAHFEATDTRSRPGEPATVRWDANFVAFAVAWTVE